MIRALGVGLFLILSLFLAEARAATIYIGDAAASGKAVIDGNSAYTSTSLTLAFVKIGQTYVNTTGAAQTLQLTEVNFFQAANSNAGARLTPFVAVYTGGQELGGSTALGANYSVLMIGDQINGLVTGAAVLRNLGFLTGGVNPTITLDAGATLVAGYVTTGGNTDLVRNNPLPRSGVNDYLASGNTLPGSLPNNLTGNSAFTGDNFDRNQQFNIGFVIVPEPSHTLLLGLGMMALVVRRRRS